MVVIKGRITAKPHEGIRPIHRNRNGKNTSTSIPNVNQSAGQDGLLGMEFDPNYNNTHHIFRSVRLEQLAHNDVLGYSMNIAAKITSLTSANNVSIGYNVYKSLDSKNSKNFMSYKYLITDGNILTMGPIGLTKFIH
jgi:hypothetical protein